MQSIKFIPPTPPVQPINCQEAAFNWMSTKVLIAYHVECDVAILVRYQADSFGFMYLRKTNSVHLKHESPTPEQAIAKALKFIESGSNHKGRSHSLGVYKDIADIYNSLKK